MRALVKPLTWELTTRPTILCFMLVQNRVLAMLNCWEYRKCGREPGGEKVAELGECPVAREERLDGQHGGTNGGRMCWLVRATLCGNQVQGDFRSKLGNCLKCDFFKAVYAEEGPNFSYGMKFWHETLKQA